MGNDESLSTRGVNYSEERLQLKSVLQRSGFGNRV